MGDRPTHLLVTFREWSASPARWTSGCTGRIDLAQRPHERGEIDGRLIEIGDRSVGVLARQPPVDGPLERIALGRTATRQLHWQGEREMWRELRQPLRFLRRLLRGPSDTRQARGQVLTKAVDVVVGAVRRDGIDRQIGPARELPCEQATDERDVGLDLAGMHHGRAGQRRAM